MAIGLILLANPAADTLSHDHGWLAGTIEEQLGRDGRLVPYGKGAIFVPAFTHGFDEPPVTVYSGGEVVAEDIAGARIILKPGVYRVELGSGTVGQRLRTEVAVREDHTTVVPPFWSGLSVHVVDASYNSVRGAYELIRADDREYMGIGFGSDEQAGEPVATWVLSPGLYKIVRVGESYRARTDFFTVRLAPGELTHFLLVITPEGDFEGGGEVPVEELFVLGSGFRSQLVVGGDLTFNSKRGAVGGADGERIAFRAFVDGSVSYQRDAHSMRVRLQIEEGQSKNPDEPLTSTIDRASLDGLYVYDWVSWAGPYLRLGAETNLLNAVEPLLDNITRARIVDVAGAPLEERGVSGEFRERRPFGLTLIKDGFGLNFRIFKSVSVETSARFGVGARHQLANEAFTVGEQRAPGVVDGQPVANETVQVTRLPSITQVGVEGTLILAARLTRWVLINLEVDSLVPFDEPLDTVLEIDGTVSLKLTRYLSINYRLLFLRDKNLEPPESLTQDVLVRFSWDIL